MSELWRWLEHYAGPVAVPAQWRQRLGADYETVRPIYLRKRDGRAYVHPCPHGCGCDHELVWHPDGRIVAVCQCESEDCDAFEVPPEEAVMLEVNLPRVARAVGAALCGEAREMDLGVPGAQQVGAVGRAAVPVVLLVRTEAPAFRASLAELVARLRRPFVLLAPTSQFLDAPGHELLANASAEFLDLQSHLTMSADGSLHASEAARAVLARLGQPTAPIVSAGVAPEEPTTKAALDQLSGANAPRYLLRKGQGVWRLVFDGQEGEIDDGRGIALAAYLLFNPPTGGLHGTELASLVFCHSVVQEASLSADGDSTRKLIQKQARGCLEVLQNPSASETVKDEARAELETLAKALHVTRSDSEGNADKQVRAIRRAIERLIKRLRNATDRKRNPHLALRAFGEHLHKYLWIPSSRFGGDRRARARAAVAGRFTYERPEGVSWAE